MQEFEAIAACYHEAGHVVLACLNLILPRTSTVIPDGDKAGETIVLIPVIPNSNDKLEGFELQLLHGRLRMWMAGFAAERALYTVLIGKAPKALYTASIEDIKQFDLVIKENKFLTHVCTRARLRKEIDRQADMIVEDQWPAIVAVSHLLFKKKTVTYKQAKQAIMDSGHNQKLWKRTFKSLEDLIFSVPSFDNKGIL